MTNKKLFILVLLLILFNQSNAQIKIVQFEQQALNFYRDSILPKFPSKKKIILPKNAIDNIWPYDKGNCFEELFSVRNDSIKVVAGEYYPGKEIDNIGKITISKKDKKQFKFRKSNKSYKPCLRFSFPMIYKNSVYMNICENREKEVFVYYFKMDIDGNIQKWCSEELHFVTQY